SRTPIELGGGQCIHVTVSVGVSSVVPTRESADLAGVGEKLIEEADSALYRAKSEGRNCVRQAA
ncbi:MAG: diguanylate cyclase, partial [Gammaproteobacteria bacterium]|nr:diguanylate cyclase [Gammaproteobacteria bacterium]